VNTAHLKLQEVMMMRNLMNAVFSALCAITILLFAGASAHAQKARANPAALPAAQQPLFSEYKGIRLGMTADQVRAKLGAPTMKADDQDYYMFSETESAQFAYDAAHKVVTISIDYTGAGAPDYRNVVGPSIDERDDGSLYKLVRYEAQHFWVSYCRSAGTPRIVTITIQKF
jgi:outer membrane protein assembly factor BamE (lipoprotein component of BamABCDE complex)